MKKGILLGIGILFSAAALWAQNFDPAPSDIQSKLETYLKRYGTVERIMLSDVKGETFDAIAGERYVVAFLYNVNDSETRRMMVYEQGPKGEKVNPQYPAASKGYRGINGKQLFVLRLQQPADRTGVIKYKIDTNTSATVYIYKLIAGVK
jgi:hypothetical protein